MPKCNQCSQEFTYHPDDLKFYEKINVPRPLNCPSCRHQQRSVWRNTCTLYQRKCDLCKKDIISVYSADKPYIVYCHDCWFSDKWDGEKYGRDFDFNRPFFEQFNELVLETPQLAINNVNSINSEYTHHTSRNKNCYLQFEGSTECEDALYGWACFRSKDCLDVAFCYDSELCYESSDIENCYSCSWLYYSRGCNSCSFCYDCVGCTNCFGCTNLRNQKNRLWNQPATIEEINQWQEKVTTLEGIAEVNEKFKKLRSEAIVSPAHNFQAVNSTGDYIRYTKNCHDLYDFYKAEDCGYIINGESAKDAYDCTGYGGTPSELAFQCTSTGRGSYGTFFTSLVWESRNIWYSHCIFTCQEMFGCASMKTKHHCIFNKTYSEEEYNTLREKIIEYMKSTGEWGLFFPYSMAIFGYNESRAQIDLPLEKEAVLELGAKWQEPNDKTISRETISQNEVPNQIKDTDETICDEILACEKCQRNYKIPKAAYKFYRQQNLPIPSHCPDCRLRNRLDTRNPKKLWHRQCMKAGCTNEFESTYPPRLASSSGEAGAPDRSEKVYCEKCYQETIY